MDKQPPNHVEIGAQLVGKLLNSWPSKEAPIQVQLAYCEELRQVLEPYAIGQGKEARWFTKLHLEVERILLNLRRLADQLIRESAQAKSRLNVVAGRAPSDLRRVMRRAKP